ncbi:hypothetical protein MY10362_005296 [Beauveria mimosiformis]
MIERAVASLESGQLQRAIPKARHAARPPRHLQTGFWQHGASALELSSFWPLTAGESAHDGTPAKSTASELLEPKLVATSFLLDFLYPNETQSYLHRVLAPRAKENRLRPLRRRQYSVQHLASLQPALLSATRFEGVARTPADAPAQQSPKATKLKAIKSRAAPKKTPSAPTTAKAVKMGKAKLLAEGSLHKSGPQTSGSTPDLDVSWMRYQNASLKAQQAQRPGFIMALAATDEYLACSRAATLFQGLSPEEWTDALLSAAIRSLAVCGKFQAALNKFKEGLQFHHVGGMQYIVARACAASQWQELVRVWFDYSNFMKEHADKNVPFDHLRFVPNLDTLFAAFEKHIEHTGLAQIRMENKKLFSRQVFDQLRHLMIRSVLAQPCKPSRAMDIVSRYDNTAYYQLYIESVLQSLKHVQYPKSTMRQLGPIYGEYRRRADARFTPEILRGMFRVFYATNRAGLAQLFEDWVKSDSGMDKWAYENFLKIYADSGDVAAVRDLGQRYMAAFPDSARKGNYHLTLVDAFAQSGDADGAENEISAMVKSGIQIDDRIDNLMLKCHVKAGNYKEATAYYKTIIEHSVPNAQTFELMMELHSANGDVDYTLAVFNQAQAAQIWPSESMATSLVAAYLVNGLMEEAEKICEEMTRLGITSTKIWNSLIQAYATAGKVEKCFQLLPVMQNLNLAWNHDTCRAILGAQARAKQTAPAHWLLRSAVADNLLPVTADHFAIVMNSAIDTKQAPRVDILATEMDRAGIQPNFATHLACFESGFVRAPTAERTTRLAKELVRYMQKLADNIDAPPGQRKDGPYTAAMRDVTELNRELRDIGDALKLLIDKREIALAEDLVTLYAKIRPVSEQGRHMPSDVLSVIMGAYLEDGRHERVLELWAVILKDVRRRTENPITQKIFPAYAYHLSGPLAHVAKVYHANGDGKRLLAATQAALDAGFQFTSDTWNTLICSLVELGQWEPAMGWCEKLLMPRWRGWNPQPLSLAARQELTDNRVLVASQPAVLSLQREWLRLRKLAAWSAGVTAKLQRIETQYPRLHHAFQTADVADLPPTWGARTGRADGIPGEQPKSLNKAIIKEALAAVPLQDLLTMRLTMGAQLNVIKERRARAKAKKCGRVYISPRGKRRRF